MAEATREFAIAKTMEILRAYIRKIEDAKGYLDCLSPEGRKIVEDYDKDVDGQKTLLLKASESEDFFLGMSDEMVLAYADVCRKMNERFDLNVKDFHPIERLTANGNISQIRYFLEKYQNLSNWKYVGHGCFMAKKNATLWELGGKYWKELFELPQNPDLIHIGDEIKLKKEVIDTIYEHSISDITGDYSFDSKSPDVKDLIYGIISFCAGASAKTPKVIKYGFLQGDMKNAYDTITAEEETTSKLSYFIQQYSTEGQEEDAWNKFIAIASFLGPIFNALGVLATASIEENKYQIVRYPQRKAFINSAEDEMKRIAMIKKTVKENELQMEIAYLRFLEEQIKMLQKEIDLNNEYDIHEKAEILRNFSKFNTYGAVYKDDRIEKSPESYHRINYHTLFAEEQK